MARIHTEIPSSLTRQALIDQPQQPRSAPVDPQPAVTSARPAEDTDTAQLRSAGQPGSSSVSLDVSTAAQVAEMLRATLLNLPGGGAAAGLSSPDPAAVLALIG